jgi:hypothetical protein
MKHAWGLGLLFSVALTVSAHAEGHWGSCSSMDMSYGCRNGIKGYEHCYPAADCVYRERQYCFCRTTETFEEAEGDDDVLEQGTCCVIHGRRVCGRACW